MREGGCLCGAVRYRVDGAPYQSGICHCTICRHITGSAFSHTATWHRDAFSVRGAFETYERRSFCPKCGSRLFLLFDGGAEIFLGTLDEAPNDIDPTVEVWTIRREHWLPEIEGATRYLRNEKDG